MNLNTSSLLGGLIITVLLLVSSFGGGSYALNINAFGENPAGVMWSQCADSYPYRSDNVLLNYKQTANTTQTVDSLVTSQAAFASFEGGQPASLLPAGTLQLPVAANAFLILYNILGVPASLTMDGKTLSRVWSGNITTWNHPDILGLNPTLNATALATNITLVYSASEDDGLTRLFKRALASFNDTFTSPNFTFASVLANLNAQNRTYRAANMVDRINYVVNTRNTITYVERSNTYKRKLPAVNLINRAGVNMTSTTASVKSAMDDFAWAVRAGDLTTDIFNGNGSGSYPLAYVVVAATPKEVNSSLTDCTTVASMADIFSWMQVNDHIAAAITRGGAFPLTTVYYKRMIDGLGSIRCGGVRAFNSSYLIGEGTAINTISDWIQGYAGNTFTQKYFTVSTVVAIDDLVAGDIDFALGLPSGRIASDHSVESLGNGIKAFPGVVTAVAPVYNLPELVGQAPLVLSLDVLVGIYMGRITMWDDSEIQSLNSGVVLPSVPIVVITQTIPSLTTAAFTAALAGYSEEFNMTVGHGLSVNFTLLPYNTTLNVPLSLTDLIALAGTTPYSLTWTLSTNINSNLTQASMLNLQNNTVRATSDSVAAAVSDLVRDDFTIGQFSLSAADDAWPVTTSLPFLLPLGDETLDCVKTKALVNWMYWTQTDGQAFQLAEGSDTISAGRIPAIQRSSLSALSSIMCNGEHMLSVWACISDGVVCSNNGRCVDNQCACFSGYGGSFCEQTYRPTTSSSDNLAVILGVVIPVSLGLCLLLVCLILAIVCYARLSRRKREEWNLNWDELEMGEALGMGGYGEVFKAKWRGTEVAVKMVASTTTVTKEMQKSFADEVHVMTTLRHPNVVLFMAASTKPPKMCIVMEFMALGSLYDLLHNELIPDIPFKLKVKMAFQAAKGMHFLHSSGIVHRDLKSLNLLLDNKWNVKVSDFGLTTFKGNIKKGQPSSAGVATVHWTAPEVLNEYQDVDYILADVYSFGIILWELLTRDQPYGGMSPAAVAVAVIRNNLRPELPGQIDDTDRDFVELMQTCWHEDPTIRPTFLEIMTRLSSFEGGMSRSSYTSHSSTSSSSLSITSTKDSRSKLSHHSAPSSSASSNGIASSTSNSDHGSGALVPLGGLRAPDGEVAIVFTDITRAASLWEHDAAAMRDATSLHNELMRSLVSKYAGYEAGAGRERNTGEGSFCIVFMRVFDALRWCAEAQAALLTAAWPASLLAHPGAAEEVDGGMDERVVFRGLRVRMGVHAGHPRLLRDAMTRRVEYVGTAVNAAARMTALAQGGQVVLSQQARDKLAAEAVTIGSAERFVELLDDKRLRRMGRFEMPDAPGGAQLYDLRLPGLEGRDFGGQGTALQRSGSDGSDGSSHNGSGSLEDGSLRHGGVDGGFKEDNFLTSANLCRWVIDYNEIQLGEQIGMGSYGMVYRGMWKGVEVAVKKFIKQKLDERRMLEFRAEMAFLSELHHPNIVLFIGSCVKRPNLCIVTEFVKRGSLKDIVADHTTKLSWPLKLGMLKSAALGINYLHSLSPVIVHRDIKPSNLLVDENWNVKVADFGFARIKEENVTMTRCGTPCWTAPEVIRGEKYSESADVYSFGVVMWEVASRKQPFAGCNFMAVAIEVLEGRRPKIPADLPQAFKKLVKKCWHGEASKRPTMEDVIATLDSLKSAANDGSHNV